MPRWIQLLVVPAYLCFAGCTANGNSDSSDATSGATSSTTSAADSPASQGLTDSDLSSSTCSGGACSGGSSSSTGGASESGDAVPPDDGVWPVGADDSRLLGGVAYGAWYPGGLRGGNSVGAHDHAVKFRALKTGVIDGFQFHNRTPSPSDLSEAGGDGSGGVADRIASLTIGSYRAGNGGVYAPAVHTVAADGGIGEAISVGDDYMLWPLAQPGNTTIDNPYRGGAWPVEVGKFYWLVLTNLTPVPVDNWRPAGSLEEAESWWNSDPRGVGWTTLNGNQRPETTPGTAERFAGSIGGAEYGRHLYRRERGGEWVEWTREIPFFQFHYVGDAQREEDVGATYVIFDNEYDYGSADNPRLTHIVQGDRRVRQWIRHPYAATSYDRVEVYFGHDGGLPAPSGAAMTVRVADASGSTLAVGEIEPEQVVWELSRGGDGLPNADRDGKTTDVQRRTWKMCQLDQPVTLEPDQDYSIELSSSAGGNYRMTGMMVVANMLEESTRETLKDEFHYAEWSDDGGATWQLFQGAGPANLYSKDLPIILISEAANIVDGVISGG